MAANIALAICQHDWSHQLEHIDKHKCWSIRNPDHVFSNGNNDTS